MSYFHPDHITGGLKHTSKPDAPTMHPRCTHKSFQMHNKYTNRRARAFNHHTNMDAPTMHPGCTHDAPILTDRRAGDAPTMHPRCTHQSFHMHNKCTHRRARVQTRRAVYCFDSDGAPLCSVHSHLSGSSSRLRKEELSFLCAKNAGSFMESPHEEWSCMLHGEGVAGFWKVHNWGCAHGRQEASRFGTSGRTRGSIFQHS
jgi:hypothetical protein